MYSTQPNNCKQLKTFFIARYEVRFVYAIPPPPPPHASEPGMFFHPLTKLNLNSEKNQHSFPQIIAQLWKMFPLRHGRFAGHAEGG
jgi:hypothetical protein